MNFLLFDKCMRRSSRIMMAGMRIALYLPTRINSFSNTYINMAAGSQSISSHYFATCRSMLPFADMESICREQVWVTFLSSRSVAVPTKQYYVASGNFTPDLERDFLFEHQIWRLAFFAHAFSVFDKHECTNSSLCSTADCK